MARLAIKRAADEPSPDDGMRVLVDPQWPPGLSREATCVDLWLKEAAPSLTLRRWHAMNPDRWPAFKERYRAELVGRHGLMRLLTELHRRGPVTLLHAARDGSRSNAAALVEILESDDGARP